MLDGFPNVKAWHERMASRPSWVKVIETRTRLTDEQGLMPNGMPKGMKNFQEFEANIKNESAADE
jgi:glutathione S-transferase